MFEKKNISESNAYGKFFISLRRFVIGGEGRFRIEYWYRNRKSAITVPIPIPNKLKHADSDAITVSKKIDLIHPHKRIPNCVICVITKG